MSFEIRGMAPLIQVFDMPASVAFYRDVLGFTVTGDSGGGDDSDWVMLERNGVTIMLNTAYEREYRPAAPDPIRIEAHGDTCIYFGAADVDGVFEYLRDKIPGLRPPKVAPYGMKQLYFKDPDGYNICFQWPAK